MVMPFNGGPACVDLSPAMRPMLYQTAELIQISEEVKYENRKL
jgi:hypothetical protein